MKKFTKPQAEVIKIDAERISTGQFQSAPI